MRTSSQSFHFCRCLVSLPGAQGSAYTHPRNLWVVVLLWKRNLLLTMPSELLIFLFASMLQPTLAGPVGSKMSDYLRHSRRREVPHPSNACFVGGLTAVLRCPLWLHHGYLGNQVQPQLQLRRDSLSHGVAWEEVAALKISEKIPLAGWPEQLLKLSRSHSWVLHCSWFALAAAAPLHVDTYRLYKLFGSSSWKKKRTMKRLWTGQERWEHKGAWQCMLLAHESTGGLFFPTKRR